jgi:prophage DNA circulation protein
MPDEFKNRAKVGFAGIEFPCDRYRLRGSTRLHIHLYAHVPGGDIEKLGRNLYEIEVSGVFLTSAKNYANLWPERLAALRDLFEQEWSDYLVLPSIGRIKAVCKEWDQEFVARVVNGEHANFHFVEDQSSAFLLDQIVTSTTKTIESSSAQLVTLQQAMQDALGPGPAGADLFGVIQSTANDVLAIRDQSDLAGLALANKIAVLTNLCYEADRAVEGLKDPANYPVVEALKELWDAARSLGEAVAGPPKTFRYYTTPSRMSAAEVAIAVYGDSSRATDILELNPINDAFDIPPRTRLRYIPDESAEAA